MDANQVLSTTRSVRRRLDLDRPVPRSVISDCIDLASQAPTGEGVERWRWLVIDDGEQRKALADVYRRAYAPYIEERRQIIHGAVGPGAEPGRRVMAASDHLVEVLDRVPAIVIPCQFDRPPVHDLRHLASFYGSIIPAVWSFMLALRSKGLGSAYTTLHLDLEGEAADILGIPATITQVALLPVAYSIGKDFRPAARRPAADITYWNRWGSRG